METIQGKIHYISHVQNYQLVVIVSVEGSVGADSALILRYLLTF